MSTYRMQNNPFFIYASLYPFYAYKGLEPPHNTVYKATRVVYEASWAFGEFTLRWRHNECDGVSNQQPHDCLLHH